MILKKDSGDEHKFCTPLMEKTVGVIGILNSDLFSDQFFLQCMGSGVSLLCVVTDLVWLISAYVDKRYTEDEKICVLCSDTKIGRKFPHIQFKKTGSVTKSYVRKGFLLI
jgi:hypothetical protein